MSDMSEQLAQLMAAAYISGRMGPPQERSGPPSDRYGPPPMMGGMGGRTRDPCGPPPQRDAYGPSSQHNPYGSQPQRESYGRPPQQDAYVPAPHRRGGPSNMDDFGRPPPTNRSMPSMGYTGGMRGGSSHMSGYGAENPHMDSRAPGMDRGPPPLRRRGEAGVPADGPGFVSEMPDDDNLPPRRQPRPAEYRSAPSQNMGMPMGRGSSYGPPPTPIMRPPPEEIYGLPRRQYPHELYPQSRGQSRCETQSASMDIRMPSGAHFHYREYGGFFARGQYAEEGSYSDEEDDYPSWYRRRR